MLRMLHTPRTRLMRQAANIDSKPIVEALVDFDASTQSLGSLEGAAYRLIGTATCQIDRVSDRFVCRLTSLANPQKRESLTSEELKVRFLNFVTDENLRGRIAEKTEGVRNVILALAFGSLARTQDDA